METQLPQTQGRRYLRQIDTLGVEAAVAALADRLWALLPAVYADLGLQISFREPAERRTGVCYQTVRGRVGKELLSTVVDCGETRSLPNADSYEVALTVLTTVRARGDGKSAVFTFVLGVGLTATGSAGNRVWCYSRGALERLIRTGLEARVAA